MAFTNLPLWNLRSSDSGMALVLVGESAITVEADDPEIVDCCCSRGNGGVEKAIASMPLST